jgi:hypothetical protein
MFYESHQEDWIKRLVAGSGRILWIESACDDVRYELQDEMESELDEKIEQALNERKQTQPESD